MNDFEKPLLGGILRENFTQTFRSDYSSRFYEVFENNDSFRVITKGSADTNNHKLVILCKTKNFASLLIGHLKNKGIYTINGYPLLDASSNTPIAQSVERRIIEIPLEDDVNKLNYIILLRAFSLF